jgi:integrase
MQHHAAITDPVQVGELLRAIDGYDGQPTTAAALRLAPYVFVRPTELRAAEWSEITLDGEQPEWRIPAERMKMREAHIVPLAYSPSTFSERCSRSLDFSGMCSPRSVEAGVR